MRTERSPGDAVTITFHPAEDLGRVILKPRWAADNGVETATFATKQEAEQFARVRWGWKG